MNKYLIAVGILGLVVLSAVVGGLSAAVVTRPVQTGGDFPGGVLPTNVLTGNAAAGYVQPVSSLAFAAAGGLYVGGTNANEETQFQYTATTSYPVAAITIISPTPTSTLLSIPSGGFAFGEP
jgi:hypothetical protein